MLFNSRISTESSIKKRRLELLTDIDMLFMVNKVIRRVECHSINRYAKANNKFMKDYDKNKKSSNWIKIKNRQMINIGI